MPATPLSHIEAIAFDLDDTLYDEYEYVKACLKNVADKCAEEFDVESDELYSAMTADDTPTPYDGLVSSPLGTRLPLKQFLHTYRSTTPAKLPLRQDARELLEYLRNTHPEIPLYLITDGRKTGQRAKVSALGLGRYFLPDRIIISEETGFDKHTPMPFIHAMARENRCDGWLYIGDNPEKDFKWPRTLGWHTVMIKDSRGVNIHKQPQIADIDENLRPDTIVTSLSQIIQLLNL